MLDISHKIKTLREAKAEAILKISPNTITLIKENKIPKGNPLEIAKVAAINSAKNTSNIIPYCHPLPIDYTGVEFKLNEDSITVTVEVKAIYKTGVEMEALTAASVAALTLYDMMKMLDEEMEIMGVKLLEKKGGKSDFKNKYKSKLRAAVLVMSDTIASGKKEDKSGKIIVERLKKEDVELVDYKIIPDNIEDIQNVITFYSDELNLDLILTTGGTGFSPRDNTPEAMGKIIDREIPGIPEVMRAYGQERTPYSMLSRGKAGIRGNTVIINLPGSRGGVSDSLNAIFPGILHSFKMILGYGHPEKEKEKVNV